MRKDRRTWQILIGVVLLNATSVPRRMLDALNVRRFLSGE